jgi:hypothetical protein
MEDMLIWFSIQLINVEQLLEMLARVTEESIGYRIDAKSAHLFSCCAFIPGQLYCLLKSFWLLFRFRTSNFLETSCHCRL